jgi:hypothetical protein
VMKLAVTALVPDLSPSILLNRANRFPDLHATSLPGANPRDWNSNPLCHWSIVWSIVGTHGHLIAGPVCP